ncbi:uncharacterized protein LOC123256975 [Drosophila ananassae]|nr:uncharacterized protein LOC123256975 [Drosophila ananassae]
MNEEFVDYYEVLEISRDATPTQIREAFRRQVLKWHPDRNPVGNEYIRKIYAAYEVLGDPEKKSIYDMTLANFPRTRSRSYFFIPSFSDGNAGKIKLVCFVGGVLVVAYTTYKLLRQSPPPPVPPLLALPSGETPVEPIATIVEELNAPHPSSIWTLISWLAALRSKRILRNGKLTPGLSPSSSNSTASSAANTILNALSSGPPNRIPSAVTGMSKNISPGLQSQASAASSISQPLATVADNVLSSAAKVVPKPEASSVSNIMSKTINLGPPNAKSSASSVSNIMSKTINLGPPNAKSSASSLKSEKFTGYIFQRWRRVPGFASNLKPFTIAFKNNMVEGTTNAWTWTALKARPYIDSVPNNVIGIAMATASNATLKGASKVKSLFSTSRALKPQPRTNPVSNEAVDVATATASKDTLKGATNVGRQLPQDVGLKSTNASESNFHPPSPLKATIYIGGGILVLYGTYKLANGYWSSPPPPSKAEVISSAMRQAGSASYDGIKSVGGASYNVLKSAGSASYDGIKSVGGASYNVMKSAGSATYKAMNYTGEASKSGISKIWKYATGS